MRLLIGRKEEEEKEDRRERRRRVTYRPVGRDHGLFVVLNLEITYLLRIYPQSFSYMKPPGIEPEKWLASSKATRLRGVSLLV